MLCKNSSVLTHLQSSIYEAVVQFAPKKLIKKILISSWVLLASEPHLGKREVCWPKRCHRREVWSEARTLVCVWKQKQSSLPSRNVCQLHAVWPAHGINVKGWGHYSSPTSFTEVVRRRLVSSAVQTYAFLWLHQCQRFMLSSPSVFVEKGLCASDVQKSPWSCLWLFLKTMKFFSGFWVVFFLSWKKKKPNQH